MISEENYTVDGKEVMCHFFSFHVCDVLMCAIEMYVTRARGIFVV